MTAATERPASHRAAGDRAASQAIRDADFGLLAPLCRGFRVNPLTLTPLHLRCK
jgi:hypothetical protein